MDFAANDLAGTPQAHIKRALTAMSGMSIVEPDDKQAKFRQRKPHWNLPPQHAALAIRFVLAATRTRTEAFAGHDQHGFGASRLGPA